MKTILGPLPCRECRTPVALIERFGKRRMIVTAATGQLHECAWSWSGLVAIYGEDEAVEQLALIGRPSPHRMELARRHCREAQRRRRARTVYAAPVGSSDSIANTRRSGLGPELDPPAGAALRQEGSSL